MVMLALDLFSGAGGAGAGYTRAGFTIVGVDIDSQPDYPSTFWRHDALTLLSQMLDGKRFGLPGQEKLGLGDFDLIHASPPCQGYTALKAVHGNDWPLLIEPVRDLLDQTRLPYVIENVQGAPLRRDLTLCGEMFKLDVIRHRYFEISGFSAAAPAHVPHRGRVAGWRHGTYYDGPYKAVYGNGGGKANIIEASHAMDIQHMTTLHDLVEAIPPAYTEYIGKEFLKQY
jgi:DNA (cytosine-5)-methyltransferase 1